MGVGIILTLLCMYRGGWVGLNEFVGLLVTMYRCIGAVMTICMRVAWVLVYVGREGGGS